MASRLALEAPIPLARAREDHLERIAARRRTLCAGSSCREHWGAQLAHPRGVRALAARPGGHGSLGGQCRRSRIEPHQQSADGAHCRDRCTRRAAASAGDGRLAHRRRPRAQPVGHGLTGDDSLVGCDSARGRERERAQVPGARKPRHAATPVVLARGSRRDDTANPE